MIGHMFQTGRSLNNYYSVFASLLLSTTESLLSLQCRTGLPFIYPVLDLLLVIFLHAIPPHTRMGTGGKTEQPHVLVDVVMENILKTKSWGLGAFQVIIDANTPSNHLPYRPFLFCYQEADGTWMEGLYQLTKESSFNGRPQWIEQFIGCVPVERLSMPQVDDLIDAYREPGWNKNACCWEWKRYLAVDPSSIQRALSAVEDNNRSGQSKIFLLGQTMIVEIDHMQEDWSLLERTYLQQAIMAEHFDATYSLFTAIVAREPGFLLEYFRFVTTNWTRFSPG